MALVNLDETPFEALQRSRANINPSLMERPDPGFFQGSSTALFSGIGQAWDVGAVGLSDLATPYIDRFGSEGFKEWARKESKKAEYALMDSRVDPSTMGTLAQAFHAIGQIAGSAVVGGAVAGPVGAATAVAANIGVGKYKEVAGQVDQETAAKMGLTSGLTMGAAVAAPAYLGSKLLTQMLSAAGMNIAFGGAERGITHKILEGEGYAEMAKHYKVLDQTAMTVDAIIGAAIPLGGRGLKAGQAAWDARQANALNIPQQVLDDAQTVERGLADQTRDIGLPVTNRAFDAAEQARVDAATQLLVEGRSVADLTLARDALDDTVPNPRIAEEASAMIRSVDESLKTEGEGGVVELDAELTVAARGMAEAEAAIVKPEGEPVTVGADTTAKLDVDPWITPKTFEEKFASFKNALVELQQQFGWAEVGGKLLRKQEDGDLGLGTGDVLGRTQWLPKADWWPGKPKSLTEKTGNELVQKVLEGKTLTKADKANLEFLVGVMREQKKQKLLDLQAMREDGIRPGEELETGMVARLAEIDEAKVESLATRFEDTDDFMKAVKEALDEYDGKQAAERETTGRGQVDTQAEGFKLTGQTEAEIRAAEAARIRLEDEAKAKAAAPSPDDFMLTGSNRTADIGAAAGQTDIFSIKPDEHATVLARDITSRNPEMMTTDAAGNTIPAQKLLDDADAKFKEDSGNASLIQLAIQCAIGKA